MYSHTDINTMTNPKYKFILSVVPYDLDQYMEICDALSFLSDIYPHFRKWFYEKVYMDKREIVLLEVNHPLKITYNDIAGYMILKNEPTEKKICTLYIHGKYRHNGGGSKLIEFAQNRLSIDKPLITINKDYLTAYEPIFNKFEFIKYSEYVHYYRVGKTEISYNGELIN